MKRPECGQVDSAAYADAISCLGSHLTEFNFRFGDADITRKNDTSEWLVKELKRNQTSDQTVGQVLRYIGWVRRNLANKSDRIHGLIIAHQVDDALMYAASEVPNLDVNAYEVSFTLHARKLKDQAKL